MKHLLYAAGLVLAGLGTQANASDWRGVYGVPTQVVINTKTTPATVKITGTFAMAKMTDEDLTDPSQEYAKPVKGYVYYTAAPGKEDESLQQWEALATYVDKCVTYGTRRGEDGKKANNGTVRKTSAPLSNPDAFPIRGEVRPAPKDHPNCPTN